MSDIGSTLREARMRARIDISEVETRTKIRAKYLRAIENEEWDLLPGSVYVKSFLRTYGDFLGLDSRMLIDEYKRRYERPSDNELRPIATLGRERERAKRGPLLPPWAVIAGVLVAVVVVLAVIGGAGGGNPASNKPSSPPAAVGRHRHPHRHRGTARTVTLPTAPKTVKLQLVPTGTVYVCVVNGAGAKLISGQIFSAGQTIPTETAPKLLLTLGNASVTMKVNGAPVHVAASPSAIGYLIQPSGTTPLPTSKQPTCA
jgi:cytoskeleton protein RodZ